MPNKQVTKESMVKERVLADQERLKFFSDLQGRLPTRKNSSGAMRIAGEEAHIVNSPRG